MRLIKTGPYVPGDEKLEVIQKWGESIPAYAILSHTWSTEPEDEVLFADIQYCTSNKKPAFAKLVKAMERAKLDGYGWLWIDTCCIDKTSSVELSEAINSMYSYYRKAEKCYAYMADVQSARPGEEFKTSRWWRRGWTLQELIAPGQLEFFSSEWESIGYKASLHVVITEITGIDQDYLTGVLPIEHASIAKRMSWAASRETTREEDMAYALIGIFDVNMPMLYGEGGIRAFTRLQEEIMKSDEDQSIFVWVKDGRDESSTSYHGLLADSPKDFKRTGSTIPYTEGVTYTPCTMTPRGLKTALPLTPKQDGTFVAALRCPVPGRGYGDWIAVYLQRLSIGTDQYARVDPSKLASVSELGQSQEVHVRQHFPSFATQVICPYHFFQIRSLACTGDDTGYMIKRANRAKGLNHAIVQSGPMAQPQPWSAIPLVYLIDKNPGSLSIALLVKRQSDGEGFVVMLGARSQFEVGIDVHEVDAYQSFDAMQDIFSPQLPGKIKKLEWHDVRVRVEERTRLDQRIYLVDIEVTSYAKPPTAAEMLDGVVDVFTGNDKHTAKRDLRQKVRRFWKAPGS